MSVLNGWLPEVLADTLTDSLKLLPFLLLTYAVMEYIEHKTGDRAGNAVRKAGRFGPLFGGILGIVPQCGFSAAASNLYAARVITLGTLLSIFLSTSDEMLPILISEKVGLAVILKLLGLKVLIGVTAGFLIDLFLRKHGGRKEEELRIGHLCEHEHCDCLNGGIFRSAFTHTLHILLYIFLITLVLNGTIAMIGEQRLSGWISGSPIVGALLSGLVGLIPNCAASVILTQLYLQGLLSLGAMMAGLLSGTGIGLLVLFKVNESGKENRRIVLLLYAVGVIAGLALEGFGIK